MFLGKEEKSNIYTRIQILLPMNQIADAKKKIEVRIRAVFLQSLR